MLNNISPAIWGYSHWKMLHILASAYPTQPTADDKTIIVEYINSYKKVIPCQKCRVNFEKHLTIYPLDDFALATGINFRIWLRNMHNEVNKSLGKPLLTDDMIESIYLSSGTKSNKIIYLIVALIILFLAIYVAKRWICKK